MWKMQVETVPDRTGRFEELRLSLSRLLMTPAILLLSFSNSYAVENPDVKNVLVLYSFTDRSVASSLTPLETSLRAKAPWQINFNVEYLESRRFLEKGYETSLVEPLQNTYRGRRLDLILVDAYPALQFALRHRDELFPGSPNVFFDVDTRRLAGQQIWPGVTGVSHTEDVRATIDLALRLHPRTNTVAVITNTSEFENFWLAALHSELLRHQDKIREIDLVALPADQIFARVAALPPETIVLFQRAPMASAHPAVGDYDILAWVGQCLPTYCIFPAICLDHGGIGGVKSGSDGVSLATQLARRILSGERPEDLPVVHDPAEQVRVDWRQLQRWHIPESALPPGSVILYRELTLWEHYRKYTIAAIVVIAAQALLIISLLWQRARKRKAEAVLGESEQRFQVMTDTTPSLVWMCDVQGKITYLNERRLAFTGPDPNAGYGDTWIAYVHPDDQTKVLDTFLGALKNRQPFSQDYRLRRSDGTYRWMFDVASPRINGDGSFGGFIGSAIDTTDQKLAQQALEKVSGQLIEAQEKERSRIARELHDDICQRLALLSMELEQANRSSDESPASTKMSLEEIRKHCSEIAGDVQSLSHQLHSSKLDYLGIVAAIRGFCDEFSRQHEISIEFSERNVPTDLPKDVSLCLFRVAQEALHNAVKHSGVSQFAVELLGTDDAVELVVSDAGTGFDVETVKKKLGLGLLSMQERVHLVHGTFSVKSQPWQGTKILAVVPLVAEKESSPDDGDITETTSMTGRT